MLEKSQFNCLITLAVRSEKFKRRQLCKICKKSKSKIMRNMLKLAALFAVATTVEARGWKRGLGRMNGNGYGYGRAYNLGISQVRPGNGRGRGRGRS